MRPGVSSLCFASALCAVTFCCSSALAGGFEYGTDNGALSIGRAGASTALASDPSAIYTNVAGMTYADRADIYLGTSLLFRRLTFDPAAEDALAVENGVNTFFAPMLSASIRLSSFLHLIVGVNGPAALGQSSFNAFEGDQMNPMRYDLTYQNILFIWPSIGLGLTIPGYDALRIAATFQPSFVHMTMMSYTDSTLGSYIGDIKTELDLWDPFVPAGQLGILWRFWRFQVGAQLRLTAPVSAEGDVVPIIQGDGAEDLGAKRPTVRGRFEFDWPMAVLRTGIRYFQPREGAEDEVLPHRRELFDIELDFIYESTSNMDAYRFTLLEAVDIDGNIMVEVPQRTVVHNWKDTFALRLGGSVNLLDGDLTISAGVSWENDSVENGLTRLDYTPWMRVGLALGVTYRVWIMDITLAYQHIFMFDRTVSQSDARVCPLIAAGTEEDTVCERSPEEPGSENYPSVNAGEYTSANDIVALSLTFRL